MGGPVAYQSGRNDQLDSQANAIYARNLKGKLMLAHGMMDDNVPVSNTMLLADALEKANKKFSTW